MLDETSKIKLTHTRQRPMKDKIILIFTIMLCGRAMTLAYINSAGNNNPGDPPAAWLMPLIGDAVIGLTGLYIVFLLLKKPDFFTWVVCIVWNAVAIWDALSAFIINSTNPWPEFFMIQAFGNSMFFIASAMHLVIIYMLCQADVRQRYLN